MEHAVYPMEHATYPIEYAVYPMEHAVHPIKYAVYPTEYVPRFDVLCLVLLILPVLLDLWKHLPIFFRVVTGAMHWLVIRLPIWLLQYQSTPKKDMGNIYMGTSPQQNPSQIHVS